jgi:uncharacterized membrane protein YfcA
MAVKKSPSPLTAVAAVLVIILSACTGFLTQHRHDTGALAAAIILALAVGVGLGRVLAHQRPPKQD